MSLLTEQTLQHLTSLKKVITRLHEKITLHSGQIIAKQKLFQEQKKLIFLQCGRNFGKSWVLAYCAVRWALTFPRSVIYIIGPQRKLIAEILWHSNVLKNMIPEEFIESQDDFNKSELRITLKNGSFIKLDGSDNEDSYRGPKPHFVCYDEFREFKPGFHEAMDPNLAPHQAPLLIASTPPDQEGYYTQFVEFVKKKMIEGHRNYFYLELPTSTNPNISKEWLLEKEKECEEKGEVALWLREYMAKFIPGGVNAVFPMFIKNKNRIVKAASFIENLIARDKHKLNWYVVYDPGSYNSRFGAIFAAINPHTSQIYIVDEIYEKDRMRTSTRPIWGVTEQKIKKHFDYPDRWLKYYDEAAAWFANELNNQFGVIAIPTKKRGSDKDSQISLIKDLFLSPNKIFVSSECKNFIAEIENCVTDQYGKIPDGNDDLIDPFRYLLSVSNYSFNEEPIEDEEEQMIRDEMDIPRKETRSLQDDFLDNAADNGVVLSDNDFNIYDTSWEDGTEWIQ